MSHLNITAGNRRSIKRIVARKYRNGILAIIACVGATLFINYAEASAATSPSGGASITQPNPNIEMFEGYDAAKHKVVNTTTRYIGHGQWKTEGSKTSDGGLIVYNHGWIAIRLTAGEELIQADADYGTIRTPAFNYFPMGINDVAPPCMPLKASNGEIYMTPRSSVYVLAYKPGIQQPPSRGSGK